MQQVCGNNTVEYLILFYVVLNHLRYEKYAQAKACVFTIAVWFIFKIAGILTGIYFGKY